MKKPGYLTQSFTTRVTHQGTYHLSLAVGQSLDIFALNKSFAHTQGLAGITISIDDKPVGQTDLFGHFSYPYHGRTENLLHVSFKTQDYLPEVFATDFVTGSQLTLVRHLTFKTPQIPKVALLPLRIVDTLDPSAPSFQEDLDKSLRQSYEQQFFQTACFQESPWPELKAYLERQGLSVDAFVQKGWEHRELRQYTDAVIQPTFFYEPDSLNLEASIIAANGQTLASVRHTFPRTPAVNADVASSFAAAVQALREPLLKAFPYEGAVLSLDGKELTFNLGSRLVPSLGVGQRLAIFGMQMDPVGASQTQQEIAQAVITAVGAESSIALVSSQEPRSVLSRGDSVVLRPSHQQQETRDKSYAKQAPLQVPTHIPL